MEKKIFANYTSDRGFVCRINKELKKQNTRRKTKSPIKRELGCEIEKIVLNELPFFFFFDIKLAGTTPSLQLLLCCFTILFHSSLLCKHFLPLVLGPDTCVQHLKVFFLYLILSTISNQIWIPLPTIWFIAFPLHHRFIGFEINTLTFLNNSMCRQTFFIFKTSNIESCSAAYANLKSWA